MDPPPWATRWRDRARDIELTDLNALGKWIAVSLLVGALAGTAFLAFDALIHVVEAQLLGTLVGFHVKTVGHLATFTIERMWALPLVMAAAGLAGGLIVWKWAPDAAGIGTDAVVKAFHEGRPVPLRVALLKMVTSSLTVGSGATSGIEGPIAQIGAGLGSTAGRLLRLDARERTIALCAGLAAGIAAAFKAPLAGALIGVEVFYREDFEVEAILPALFAAVVGYSIVGFAHGWQPLYHTNLDPYSFGSPATLPLYALLGVCCALLSRIAFRIFFPVQRLAKRMWLPAATAIGAFATGLLALACIRYLGTPTVVGTGHEWLQNLILDQPLEPVWSSLALGLLAASLIEILASAFTIGMGNSGGIFGPSLVAGGFMGAAFGAVAHALWPMLVPTASPFVIVGMIAYFAGTVKAPVGTIVMVAEITGGYGLLGPAMVAVVIAYLLSGKHSLFPSQVRNRLESPAKAHDFEPLVLRRIKAKEVARPPPVSVTPETPVLEAEAFLTKTGQRGLVVLDGKQVKGMVTRRDIERVPMDERGSRKVADVMAVDVHRLDEESDLFAALAAFVEEEVQVLPVVGHSQGEFLGVIEQRDIHAVLASAKRQVGGVHVPVKARAEPL